MIYQNNIMDDKELWVRFACAALSGLVSDGAFENNVEKDCEAASCYADEMLECYHNTFSEDGE